MRRIESSLASGRVVRGFLLAAGMAAVVGCVDIEDGDRDGYTPRAGDCNDDDPHVHPDLAEIPGDGVDDNCNGNADEDSDADGYSLDGTNGGRNDCDDSNPNVFPGAPEAVDGVDQDCDEIVDNHTELYDDDGDGFAEVDGDCNDRGSALHPGAAETLNGVDDDCDGIVDEGGPEVDDDGDGLSENEGDCNDANAAVYPGAPETGLVSGVAGDGLDNDCDRIIDEGTTAYDDDGDGFSEDGSMGGFPDCDDYNPVAHPGAPEDFSDGLDSDCDSVLELSPADGPQPAGFNDLLPSDAPASALGEPANGIDYQWCDSLDFLLNSVEPFQSRVYALHFYDVQNLDGSGGTPDLAGFVDTLVKRANFYFTGAGVQFDVDLKSDPSMPTGAEPSKTPEFNNISYETGAAAIRQALCKIACAACDAKFWNCVPKDGRIPVLIVDSIQSTKNGVVSHASGVAYHPNSSVRGIVLARRADSVLHGDTFPHELGHFFGLHHTFCGRKDKDCGQQAEPVSREPSLCGKTGDLLCDTPADPGTRGAYPDSTDCVTPNCVAASCNPAADAAVPGALFQPDIHNVMSYYPCDKGSYFTEQQLLRMLCAMRNSPNLKGLTQIGYSCRATCCDGSQTIVGTEYSVLGCESAAYGACYFHGGLQTYTHQSEPPTSKTIACSQPCEATCCDNMAHSVDPQFSAAGCEKAAYGACYAHGGLKTYTYQSEPPTSDTKVCVPYGDCYVRCRDDTLTFVGNFQSSVACVNAGKLECAPNSDPVRIEYSGYYAWCAEEGCWVKCTEEDPPHTAQWYSLPNATLSSCTDKAKEKCKDNNMSYGWSTWCAEFP